MQKEPRVSIGMPVYNGAKLMSAAVESILQQTYRDFELIISDNASTDNTEAIGREFVRRDTRVRYVRNDRNVGAMPNFDRVVDLARGEYFKWAAYDDTLAPDYLEKCVGVLEQDPSIVLCQAKTLYVDLQGNSKRSGEKERRLDSTHAGVRFWDVVVNTHNIDEYYGVMRTEVLRRTSLNLPFAGSDKVLLVELAVFGRFFQIPEYLFLRGAHPEQYFWISGSRGLRDKWMDTKANFSVSELKVLAGYWKAVWSVPLPWKERAKCHLALLYYAFGWGPWKRRLKRALGLNPPAFGSAGESRTR